MSSTSIAILEDGLASASAAEPAVERDAALLRALQRGDPVARAELFDRYGKHVERVLARVLGVDAELSDLLHEVFARAFEGVTDVREGAGLKPWLTSVAVFTARGCIRRRVRRRWLSFLPWHELPEVAGDPPDYDGRAALTATYELLARLPTDERIAFALRFIDGMELTEVAAACHVSLATIKRRLARASAAFEAMAVDHPVVAEWLEGGRSC